MLDSPAEWWDDCPKIMSSIELHSVLDDIIKSQTDNKHSANCFYDKDRDIITISTEKIKCVPFKEIEIRPVWNPTREQAIKGWANEDSLMSVKLSKCLQIVHMDGENEDNADDCTTRIIEDIPRFNRTIDLDKGQTDLYRISDGIHRTSVGRALGISCIMADVIDEYCMSMKKFLELSKRKKI